MSSKNILMVTGDYAEDYEVMVPFQALQTVGHHVDVTCPEKDAGESIVTSLHQSEGYQTYTERQGHHFELNTSFAEVDVSDYDLLMLPGGRAPEYLRVNEDVLELIRSFDQKDKPIAAICHGAQILAAAEVLEGRSCSAYKPIAPEIRSAGGEFVDPGPEGAHVDGNLVTAPTWTALSAWLSAVLDVLDTSIEL